MARNDLAKRLSWTSQRTLSSIVDTSLSLALVTSDAWVMHMDTKPLVMGTVFGPYSRTMWALLRETSLCISQALMFCWLYPSDRRKHKGSSNLCIHGGNQQCDSAEQLSLNK